MLNLSVILEDAARREPDRDAVVSGDLRLSYAAVNAAANQVANLLGGHGIGRGDKVALCSPNLPYFPVIYFGILKAGAVVVPLDVEFEPWELAYHLDDCQAKALFYAGDPLDAHGAERALTGFEHTDSCERLFVMSGAPSALDGCPTSFETVATESTDTAVILYGSGASGRSAMGAELTHLNLLLNAIVSDAVFERMGRDVELVTLPLFHAFGQTVCMNAGFFRRATLVLMPRFETGSVPALIEREQITFLADVPAHWARLLYEGAEGPADLAGLRVAVSGGSALPAPVRRGLRERYGIEVLEGYGLAEASPVSAFNVPAGPAKPGSVGRPVWGVQMKLVDLNWNTVGSDRTGEIAVRGHNVMKGYYRRPGATAEVLRDGWLRTGDLAWGDEDGYFHIVDRASDVIVRDGVPVYPRTVEEVLLGHPEVCLAAVVGVPDEEHGDEIKACVIRAAGSTLTEKELMAWSTDHLMAELCPHIVEFRDELPMTATGKVIKRMLQ